jgi:hypothetical protein
VNDPRGLAPVGWHIPSNKLFGFLEVDLKSLVHERTHLLSILDSFETIEVRNGNEFYLYSTCYKKLLVDQKQRGKIGNLNHEYCSC